MIGDSRFVIGWSQSLDTNYSVTNHQAHHKYSVSNEIVVPGSVANLGGGFDTLAVAVQLYLRVRIVDVRADGGARLVVVNSRPPVSGDNAVERAFAAIARRAPAPVPTVFVDVESDIPMAAGLGSSAAASVAGLRVFEEVTGPVPETTLLAVATSLEGHADNAAAALLGGHDVGRRKRRGGRRSCTRSDGRGRRICD